MKNLAKNKAIFILIFEIIKINEIFSKQNIDWIVSPKIADCILKLVWNFHKTAEKIRKKFIKFLYSLCLILIVNMTK